MTNPSRSNALGLGLSLALAACADADSSDADGACQTVSCRGEERLDAIVVGSGYGGSVAALRLGRAKLNTKVLERGRRWTVRDAGHNATFATLESVTSGKGDARSTWLDTRCAGNVYLPMAGDPRCPRGTGILEHLDSEPELHHDASPLLRVQGVEALVAAGVGGGSLVNNGVIFPPQKAAWDVAFPASQLPLMARLWRELSGKYFERARTFLAPEPVPADILSSDFYAGTRLFDGFAAAAGYPEETVFQPETLLFGRSIVPVAVNWELVREELSGERVPSVTAGEAWWGTNSGAKRSLDQPDNYLGLAEATGNVSVLPLHTVTGFTYDAARKLYIVNTVRTDEAYAALDHPVFTTQRLFLAAGSLATTKFLVRARDRGDLPQLSQYVGTHWSTNGDFAHLRVVSDHALPQGGPATVRINDFQALDNPIAVGVLSQRVPSSFAAIPELRALQGALLTIGFGIPEQTGHFEYDAATDTVVLDWPTQAAANVYARGVSVLTNPKLPGAPQILPMAQSMQCSVHPLGGVPLGLATDDHCGLLGYDGLYAVDGSIVPGAGAVAPPALLISALVERCMDEIIARIAAR